MAVDNIPRPGILSYEASNFPKKLNKREINVAKTALYNKDIDETFDSAILVSAFDKETGAPLASEPVAGDEVVFMTRKSQFEAHVQSVNGTAAAWFFPYTSTSGLELPTDADATNGVTGWEISNGILTTSYAGFTVGTSEPCFFEAKVKIDDISSLTELWMGFRKAAAYGSDPGAYTDYAAFDIGKDANGQIEIHTNLNNGGVAETDTTEADWEDADEYTLRIEVQKNGQCTFLIDGAAPTVTASFTFDSGDVIVPFLAFTAESLDAGVSIATWRVGYL